LFPATSEREKISFHQLNKETGNRIRYRKVDAETGDEVDSSHIIKGYEVAKGEYIELQPEELEAVAIDSKRVVEIAEFVPKAEIDELYLRDPYFIVPDGEVGQQAFAVIREAIRKQGMVALGKVVFTSREHIIALEPRDKGMVGVTLRYPYEVRQPEEYFDTIDDEKVPKDMLDLAIHIVDTKRGKFEPERFEDHYENALKELLRNDARISCSLLVIHLGARSRACLHSRLPTAARSMPSRAASVHMRMRSGSFAGSALNAAFTRPTSTLATPIGAKSYPRAMQGKAACCRAVKSRNSKLTNWSGALACENLCAGAAGFYDRASCRLWRACPHLHRLSTARCRPVCRPAAW
jgi:DNA end-binding protein Ku